MLLALRIIGAAYIVAIAAFLAICHGALRRHPDTPEIHEVASNVIPFERGAAIAERSQTPENQAVQS
ncbi:MAG: hypothetical protein WA414_03645 [Acidobacteriaceae bacterium]